MTKLARDETKEVVWVYGMSAAGKETFIRKIINEKPVDLLQRFRWTTKRIAACDPSLRWIGQFNNDPVTEKREDILSDAPKQLETSNVVLIKGQDVDFKAKRPQRLQDLLPDATHRLIYIDISTEEAFSRWPRKSWWDGSEKYQDAVLEHKDQAKFVAELRGFEIEIISGSAEDTYLAISEIKPT